MADLRDKYGNVVYRIEGDRIKDIYGNWKYTIVGDRINDTYGNWKYEIRGDYLFDVYGNRLGEMKNLADMLDFSESSSSDSKGSNIKEFLAEKSDSNSISGCLATLAGILFFIFKANLGGKIGLILGVIVFIICLVTGSPPGNGIIAIFLLGIAGAVIGAIINFIKKMIPDAANKEEKPTGKGIIVAVLAFATPVILGVLWMVNSSDKAVNNAGNVAALKSEKQEANTPIASQDNKASKSENDLETAVSKRLLTDNDLRDLSKQQLRILRNTVFARHGRKFKSEDLQEYFSAKDWYNPKYDDVDHLLNSYEKKNVAFIQKYE